MEEEFFDVFAGERRDRIQSEYQRIREVCYLDHTGCAPYCKSLIEQSFKDLNENVYSNPHSNSLTSKHCSDSVDQIRFKILQHFNTNTNEYSVIFTSGATAALKLVAESFCWSSTKDRNELQAQDLQYSNDCGSFVYMEDNHTSVLGMRDVVKDRGANVICLQHKEVLDIFSDGNCYTNNNTNPVNSLFVYSAQCNFSGVKYPLSWIDKVHNNILEETVGKRSNWYCLVDAATYVSTNKLDLNEFKPDFICISFYKLFGYPTGLGALLVRNSSAKTLEKKYYGGGTVLVALSAQNQYVPRPVLHERFEDGTLNFLSILTLHHGFSTLYNLVENMDNVSRHCFNLAKYVFKQLLELHHFNGSPAVHLYTDTPYDDISTQGNIVNFNMLRPNGDFIGFAEVLNIANLHNVQLRTGCFCNPGACRRHLGLTTADVKKHYQSGHICGDDKDLVEGQPTGSVRISFGYYTTKEDVDTLITMLKKCFVKEPIITKTPAFWNFIASNLRNKFNRSHEKLCPIEQLEAMKYIYFWYENVGNVCPEYELEWESTQTVNKNSEITKGTHLKTEAYLSHIFLYPIKSCGRFPVQEWKLDPKGLKYDRLWMITNSSGVALTQKKEPRMCTIRPIVDTSLGKLYLTCKGFQTISIDLECGSQANETEASLCQSKVCGDMIQGIDCGDEVGQWISDVLNRPGLRLIRQLPKDSRTNKISAGELSLANQAQFLLISGASVNWLSDLVDENSDCKKESMLDRFRCNFVITGIEKEFQEQQWRQIKIGDNLFNVDGPCGRCQMICIDQDTGKKTKEPLTTLAASMQGKLKFGVYLSQVENKYSQLSTGDSLDIID